MKKAGIVFKAGAKAPSIRKLSDTFTNTGYRIKKNTSNLELLVSSDVAHTGFKILSDI